MKYSFTSRIRYSEIGEDGNLTLPGLINYFQDCSTFQSEAIGEGVAELKKRGCAWVLSAWQIHVRRYPSWRNSPGRIYGPLGLSANALAVILGIPRNIGK